MSSYGGSGHTALGLLSTAPNIRESLDLADAEIPMPATKAAMTHDQCAPARPDQLPRHHSVLLRQDQNRAKSLAPAAWDRDQKCPGCTVDAPAGTGAPPHDKHCPWR